MKKFILFSLLFFTFICSACNNSEKELNTLQKINSRGKVFVGTDASFPPYEFVENNKIVGYGSEILAEIIKNWNVELEQYDVPFTAILPGLIENKFDFIATAVTVTPERKDKFSFTTPIGDSTILLFVKNDNQNIKVLDDMSGKKIGCNISSAPEKELLKYNEKLIAEGKPEIIINTYDNHQNLVLDLENDRIDGAIGTGIIILSSSKNGLETLKIIGPIADTKYVSWVVRKEDEALLKFLNEEILKLKKNGKLAELQKKWFGTTWDLPDELPK